MRTLPLASLMSLVVLALRAEAGEHQRADVGKIPASVQRQAKRLVRLVGPAAPRP
jgi:hypothetical protein